MRFDDLQALKPSSSLVLGFVPETLNVLRGNVAAVFVHFAPGMRNGILKQLVSRSKVCRFRVGGGGDGECTLMDYSPTVVVYMRQV